MQLLFIGDVFSTPGVRALQAYLAERGDDFDLIVANGENAAGGFGLTRKHFEQMRAAGVDVVTLGNHSWDQREVIDLVEETPRLIRPLNYPVGTPGLGAVTVESRSGELVTVMQAMGRVFMDAIDDPFRAVDEALAELPQGRPVIVDFHAEATSEKKVMGYHLRGRVTAVIGTHTHVQTADEGVYGGTATITDVGMTGVQDSSIGMGYEEVRLRFVTKMPHRFRPATGPGTLCGVAITIEGNRASQIERIRWDHRTTPAAGHGGEE
jgi:metallophosphoesterase (TIGR00282 family)